MDGTKRKRIGRLLLAVTLAVVVGAAFLVLRGPHISNALKKLILPELEMASGRKVICQKIYINLFPLFVEAKGLKAFDERGDRILTVDRAKAYVDVSGLFSRRIAIRRLVIKTPAVTSGRGQIEEIIENVKRYLAMERDTALKVKISVVEVQKGHVIFTDEERQASFEITGLGAEVIAGDKEQRVAASAARIVVNKAGWPQMEADADLALVVKGEEIGIRNLEIGSAGSKLSAHGEYAGKKGEIGISLDLLVMTVKKMFNLDRTGEGRVSSKGSVRISEGIPVVDLAISGSFHIETLMELLKVEERVEGFISLKGEVDGPLDDLRAKGTAVLTKGNLFDVDVESLKCGVSYGDGIMRFTDGTARIYNGSASVSASITLPVVHRYTVEVAFSGADSRPLFRLIGWDPGVQPGKVNGTLVTAGSEFHPEGWFEYRSASRGKDVLGRISDITGKYSLEGGLLSLQDLRLLTEQTGFSGGGTVDLGRETLALDVFFKSSDVLDLLSPYHERLRGGGEFAGKVSGTFDDPVISGRMRILNPVYDHYASGAIEADVVYRKERLDVQDMSARGIDETFRLRGSVYFKEAKNLFDLASADYRLEASVKGGDLQKFVRIFYGDFQGSGKFSSEISIIGRADNPEIKGRGTIAKGELYGAPFDSAELMRWRYAGGSLFFDDFKLTRGKSVLTGMVQIDDKGRFKYSASSEKLHLSDLIEREIKGEAIFTAKSEGHGTFDDPSIAIRAKMIEGRLKGKSIGAGALEAEIREKNISVNASLFSGRATFSGKGRLEGEIPWEGRIEIQSGRYDSVVSALLKDVPEDLILNLNGSVFLKGSRSHLSASATVRQLNLSMYGYSFANEREIVMELEDRKLSFERISLRSGSAVLHMTGGLVIGRQFNVVFEGSTALLPFRGLSGRIGLLKGDVDFVLAVTGDWENPQINGGLNIRNGAFGLKEYTHRLSSVSGYIYMDNDKVVLQRLSGKIGGGDAEITGVVYLKRFSPKRFYIEADLDNITTSVSADFSVNFGGSILYKGTPAEQMISGDIFINRARYKERVEWKSWLLKARKTERLKSEISEFEKAALNVRISGRENIRIDNNVARADVAIDTVLRGTVYRPVLLGRIETREGTVYFRNNEFRILYASADFADPNRINPIVDISAETIVKGYKIKMNLEGQIEHFSISLSSDPVLKEMDILALLTVGQTGGELKGLEGGIGAGEATSFVTGKLQDVVEERFRKITGLDRFQIDPYVSKNTGAVEPRVTVSKRLLGEKVFVTYTSTVGSTEEQVIKVEYFVGKNVSLVGVRDERGILGGDVKLRFEFK